MKNVIEKNKLRYLIGALSCLFILGNSATGFAQFQVRPLPGGSFDRGEGHGGENGRRHDNDYQRPERPTPGYPGPVRPDPVRPTPVRPDPYPVYPRPPIYPRPIYPPVYPRPIYPPVPVYPAPPVYPTPAPYIQKSVYLNRWVNYEILPLGTMLNVDYGYTGYRIRQVRVEIASSQGSTLSLLVNGRTVDRRNSYGSDVYLYPDSEDELYNEVGYLQLRVDGLALINRVVVELERY